MKKIILTLAVVVLAISGASAQIGDTSSGRFSIKTKDGFIFVNNDRDQSFYIEFAGKDVRPATGSEVPMFTVDKILIQIMTVPVENFVPPGKKLDDLQTLAAHRIWESDYLSTEIYDQTLKIEAEELKIGERHGLFWGFTRPKLNDTFKHDYFLTTVFSKTLVGVGSPVEGSVSVGNTKDALIKVLKTLKTSEKPFDIEGLSENARQSAE
jgi:hypothetical protein